VTDLSATIANDFGPETPGTPRSGEGSGVRFKDFGWEKVGSLVVKGSNVERRFLVQRNRPALDHALGGSIFEATRTGFEKISIVSLHIT
jgi:hypothetical protein